MVMSEADRTPQSRRRPAPRLGRTFIEMVHDLARDLLDPYRPERHYMRGPGPKWQAKHASAVVAGAAGSLQSAAI
jgi:hypothetical protein